MSNQSGDSDPCAIWHRIATVDDKIHDRRIETLCRWFSALFGTKLFEMVRQRQAQFKLVARFRCPCRVNVGQIAEPGNRTSLCAHSIALSMGWNASCGAVEQTNFLEPFEVFSIKVSMHPDAAVCLHTGEKQ